MRNKFYTLYGKRFFDLAAAISGLIFLVPVLASVALLIKIIDGSPVFFVQKRVGRNFKIFNLVKFRSMAPGAETKGWIITAGDDPRVTRLGGFLRKTKMDELPQVFNVLKGDMSFVGPRPEVEEYVNIFRRDYEEILKARPGITDYASVIFRDEENVLKCYNNPRKGYVEDILPQKIALYKQYLKEAGFLTDTRLIFLTLVKIAK